MLVCVCVCFLVLVVSEWRTEHEGEVSHVLYIIHSPELHTFAHGHQLAGRTNQRRAIVGT